MDKKARKNKSPDTLRKDSCVLATTDGKTPHCSLMAYVPGDTGEQLFLVTSSASRK